MDDGNRVYSWRENMKVAGSGKGHKDDDWLPGRRQDGAQGLGHVRSLRTLIAVPEQRSVSLGQGGHQSENVDKIAAKCYT